MKMGRVRIRRVESILHFFIEHIYRLFEADFGASSPAVSLYMLYNNSIFIHLWCHVLAAGNEYMNYHHVSDRLHIWSVLDKSSEKF
jgi:hypothetical protein